MKLAFGPDFSNWGGFLRPSQVECWRRHDPPISFAIAGDQAPNITRQQLSTCRDGGLQVESYPFLYPAAPGRGSLKDQVDRCLQTVSGFPIARLWLDVEQPPAEYSGPWPEPARSVEMLHEAVEACGSMPAGIYTGRYAWREITGSAHDFAALPLLHADYGLPPYSFDRLPDLGAWLPYGGFELHTWQFGNTQDLCGFSVDLNVRREEEEMISKSVVAPWWSGEPGGDGRHIAASTGGDEARYHLDAGLDFQLGRPQPSRIRIAFYLTGDNGPGYLRFFNPDGSEAEPIGYGGAWFGTVDVEVGTDGFVPFRAEGGDVVVRLARLIGYWS